MRGDEPLISFVVTSRNDDHGGNLLHRMQVFINALLAQCDRHELPAELVIVEWNPPRDRPGLIDALRWPEEPGYCRVRIIRVPESIHRRFEHSSVLPLFQMIAKNVGIRRSKGRFILATNIDIIFSDELIRVFTSGRLKKGEMYRVDRYDVMPDVPLDASVDEQIEYCRSHQIRLNVREGTFTVRRDGGRRPEAQDVADAEGPIGFGRGWYGVERGLHGRPFRWVGDDAEILLTAEAKSSMVIDLDLEPGPGVRHLPFTLRVLNDDGVVVGEVIVRGRDVIQMRLSVQPNRVNRFVLRSPGGGRRQPGDPRTLNFRVLYCGLGFDEPDPPAPRLDDQAQESPNGEPVESVGVRARSRITRISRAPLKNLRHKLRSWVTALRGTDVLERDSGITLGSGWYDPETDYRGRRFRWVNNDAEFHVEFRDPNPAPLYLDMQVGPGAYQSTLDLEVVDSRGETVAVGRIRRRMLVRLDLPFEESGSRVFALRVHGGGRSIPQDPRILNFRVFRFGWHARPALPFTTVRLETVGPKDPLPQAPDPGDRDGEERTSDGPVDEPRPAIEPPAVSGAKDRSHAHLHTNACGDFTLMERDHWYELRGYPEFEMFSMNIDSVLCYAAHYGGAREVVLEDPCRIYHIEHATGSGWTPEGQEDLFRRLKAKKLPFVGFAQVMDWASQMWAEGKPMTFSDEGWGLVGEHFEEISGVPERSRD